MALKIHWTKRASVNYLKTIIYLEEEWGLQSAKKFAGKTNSVVDILQTFPELGKPLFRDIRTFVIVKQITLFYKVESNRLILLHFFNNYQHPGKKKL